MKTNSDIVEELKAIRVAITRGFFVTGLVVITIAAIVIK